MPTRKRFWTREEYDCAIERGEIRTDERIELIEGELVDKMPMYPPHASGIRVSEEAIRKPFASGFDVRVQMPLALDDRNEPEPDIAVVVGSWHDYQRAHPTTAVLLVEVAESSLAYDRTVKAGIYARAGIPEYWIVNIVERLLEVHRQPEPVSPGSSEYHYRTITLLSETETVTPLAAPNAVLRVADLLPDQPLTP